MKKLACAAALAALSIAPAWGQPAGARKLTTDHLAVTTYLSETVVAPGSTVNVILDVTPRAGLHVYAPGAKGYRVVAFTIDPNPAVEIRPLQYPPSEIYEFKPLNERVPAFQRPFTLVQPLVVRPGHGNRITVKGALEYQACDDRLCYPPKEIKVSHVIRVRT